MSNFDPATARTEWAKVNIDNIPIFEGEKNATKAWIRKANQAIYLAIEDDVYKPYAFFNLVLFKFSGRASEWLDKDKEFAEVMNNINLASQVLQDKFIATITERYSPRQDEDQAQTVLNAMNNLAQGKNESIEKYYHRTKDIQLDMGAARTFLPLNETSTSSKPTLKNH